MLLMMPQGEKHHMQLWCETTMRQDDGDGFCEVRIIADNDALGTFHNYGLKRSNTPNEG